LSSEHKYDAQLFRRRRHHEVVGDPTYADAILDRLVHNAYRIELRGDSMRRRKPDMPGDEKN
jgi:DNA replication protein DnaC